MKHHEEPAEKLRTFLSSGGISQRAFAESVGSHQSILSRVMMRKINPSLKLAVRIQTATGGVVRADAWHDTEDVVQ